MAAPAADASAGSGGPVKKVRFWSKEFPEAYATAWDLVDQHTTSYPAAKLAQLSYEDRGRLHRKLVKAVDEVLPDSWSNWESSAENSNAKSKTAADVFVANANFRLRLKKKQGACKKSVHSTPGGDRRDVLGEQAEQRSKMRAGTLVLSETMVMSVKMNMNTHGLDADQVGEIAALRQQGSSMADAIVKVGRTRKKEGVLENSEPLEAAMEAAIKRRKHVNSRDEQLKRARKMAKDKPEELAADPALERKFVNSHPEQLKRARKMAKDKPEELAADPALKRKLDLDNFHAEQLKRALKMAKDKPEELAADPALAKIYAKYIEPRVAMYKDNLDRMMKDPVLAGQLGTTMSVIQARLVEIKKKPRSVLAGMSVTEHIEDQDKRLPALISAPHEDEEDLVFDPARHRIERLTYFYKDSQDPSRNEWARNNQARGAGWKAAKSSKFCDIPPQKAIDISRAAEYIDALVAIDGREECEEDVAETEGRGKKKKQGRNRPPFVKCLTTKQNFTITELENDLSGDYEVMYESGWTPCCRIVEDDLQDCTDHLPFGMRLHRRAGAGARTSKKDGLPGFLARTGIAVYKATRLKFDSGGKLVSFYGVGKTGKLTKVYINH